MRRQEFAVPTSLAGLGEEIGIGQESAFGRREARPKHQRLNNLDPSRDSSGSDAERPVQGILLGKTGLRRFIGPKRALVLAAYAAFGIYAWHLHAQGVLEPAAVRDWVRDYSALSVAIFLAVYVLTMIATLPTLPYNLAAGMIWGTLVGGVLSAAAAFAGAVTVFLGVRLLFGQPLARRFNSKSITWLQEEFNREGWRFIAFLRVNPVFPTGVVNYLLGLTSIGLGPYAAATLVFLLPPSLLVAWIGHRVGTFALEGEAADIWNSVLGVSAAVTLLVVMRYLSRFIIQHRRT